MKTCSEYSLEAPHRGASNEYPQHVYMYIKEKQHLETPLISMIWTDRI